MKYVNLLLLSIFTFIIFLFPEKVAAGKWIKVHENSSFYPINDAIDQDGYLKIIYAVGDNGMLYRTEDYGYTWTERNLVDGINLRSLSGRTFAPFYNQNPGLNKTATGDNPEILICGENGIIINYDIVTKTALIIDTLTTLNLNSIKYDSGSDRYWVVGDSGYVAYSLDQGLSWKRFLLSEPIFDIKMLLIYGYQSTNFYFFGNDSQNIYIKRIERSYSDTYTEVGTDTIFNEEIITGVLTYGYSIYIVTKSRINGEHRLRHVESDQSSNIQYRLISVLPFDNVRKINFFDRSFLPFKKFFWIVTGDGEIWHSIDYGLSWERVFVDPQRRELNVILSSLTNDIFGMALGNEGLVINSGIKVMEFSPNNNALLFTDKNEIYAKFMSPPDFKSLDTSIFIKSNYTGLIPLSLNFHSNDSLAITMKAELPPYLSTLAKVGEEWNVTFSNGIQAVSNSPPESLYQYKFSPFDFTYRFIPKYNASFNFSLDTSIINLKIKTTNWITGLFNNDDLLDFVTFSLSDSLVCVYQHRTLNDSIEWLVDKFSAPPIRLLPEIKRQIKLIDFNHDILPDIMLFDDSLVYFMINTSTPEQINFEISPVKIQVYNLQDAIPINDNSNKGIDIVTNELYIVLYEDINADFFPSVVVDYNAFLVSKLLIGDINNDIAEDLIYLDNGILKVFLGSVLYGISMAHEPYYYSDNKYTDIYLGNLDGDSFMDILAISSNSIDVFSPSIGMPNQNLGVKTLFPINQNEVVQDVAIQDVGNYSNMTSPSNSMDIILLTSDSLYIFANQSQAPGEFVFDPEPVFTLPNFDKYDQIETADWDNDQEIEIGLLNKQNGQMYILDREISWQARLNIARVEKQAVQLNWAPLPPSTSTLNYYRVLRSLSPEFTSEVQNFQTTDTTFVDDQVEPFMDYWYRVDAVSENGQPVAYSNVVHVQTYRELGGTISGVLADTTLPYWARSSLTVPASDTLKLQNGVQIGFNPDTRLQVYGGFESAGLDINHMVELFAVDSARWQGIVFANGEDTVKFHWTAIRDANVGIASYGRAVDIRLTGIMQSSTAILLDDDAQLTATNFVIDTVDIGVDLRSASQARLRNGDFLHCATNSVRAQQFSSVYIKNSIFWFNEGPPVVSDSAQCSMDYCTVDQIGPKVNAQNISQLAPLFDMESKIGYQVLPRSPTIDAGDPKDDYSQEPQPNGGRINQGAFGNTPFATPSYQPRLRLSLTEPLQSLAYHLDSTMIKFVNYGFAELLVEEVRLKQGKAFSVDMNTPFTVAANDTLLHTIHFAPLERGAYFDTLIVRCNDPHLPNGELQFALQGTALNNLPQLQNKPLPIAYVDSLYVFKPEFYDVDGDSVVLIPATIPAWLNWSPENFQFSGTPTLNDTGRYELSFVFDDQHEGVDSARFTIEVYRFGQLPIAPVIALRPVGTLTSHQAAIKFKVQIKDSTVSQVKDATNTYWCTFSLRDEESRVISQGLQKGMRDLEFYPLKDGIYKLDFKAYKEITSGKVLKDSVKLEFKILASQYGLSRFRWYMLSIPRLQKVSWQQFGHPDSAALRFRWSEEQKKYLLLKTDELLPGQAFWLMPLKNLKFDVNAIPVTTGDSLGETGIAEMEIPLEQGWNQIGLPAPFFKIWQHFKVRKNSFAAPISLQQAWSDSLLIPVAFWFEQTLDFIGYHVQEMDSLHFAEPWKGYWLYAEKPCTLTC